MPGIQEANKSEANQPNDTNQPASNAVSQQSWTKSACRAVKKGVTKAGSLVFRGTVNVVGGAGGAFATVPFASAATQSVVQGCATLISGAPATPVALLKSYALGNYLAFVGPGLGVYFGAEVGRYAVWQLVGYSKQAGQKVYRWAKGDVQPVNSNDDDHTAADAGQSARRCYLVVDGTAAQQLVGQDDLVTQQASDVCELNAQDLDEAEIDTLLQELALAEPAHSAGNHGDSKQPPSLVRANATAAEVPCRLFQLHRQQALAKPPVVAHDAADPAVTGKIVMRPEMRK